MHVYRTVRYRTVLKSKPIRHLREDHGEINYLPYGAVHYSTAPLAVCGGALYRTGQTARANILCGGSRSQAHAKFRYHIIQHVGDKNFAKYWLISLVAKSCSMRVTIDMATRVRALLPVP